MQIRGRKKLLSERHVYPFVAYVVSVVVHLKVWCFTVIFSCFLVLFLLGCARGHLCHQMAAETLIDTKSSVWWPSQFILVIFFMDIRWLQRVVFRSVSNSLFALLPPAGGKLRGSMGKLPKLSTALILGMCVLINGHYVHGGVWRRLCKNHSWTPFHGLLHSRWSGKITFPLVGTPAPLPFPYANNNHVKIMQNSCDLTLS